MPRVVIVGGGPAAWTAALYCARAALITLVFEGELEGSWIPGGQLMTTTEVENYPGLPGVDGSELVQRMKQQALSFGAQCIPELVKSIDYDSKTVRAAGSHAYDALILATGASAKYLGLASEAEFQNRGVSACATCDGALPRFRDKPIVVVGGGDTAMEEATFLARFASEVHVIHRGPSFTKASPIMAQRVLSNPKITPHFNATVDKVLGDAATGVTGVSLNAGAKVVPCSGMFVAIGHSPNSQLFPGTKDAQGYIVQQEHTTHTSMPGVFAAGDVADHRYRQAVTAAASGCQAGIDAYRWLSASNAQE